MIINGPLASSEFVPQSTAQIKTAKGHHVYVRGEGYREASFEPQEFPMWLHHTQYESILVDDADEKKAKEDIGYSVDRVPSKNEKAPEPGEEPAADKEESGNIDLLLGQLADARADAKESKEAQDLLEQAHGILEGTVSALRKELGLAKEKIEEQAGKIEEQNKLLDAQDKEIAALNKAKEA